MLDSELQNGTGVLKTKPDKRAAEWTHFLGLRCDERLTYIEHNGRRAFSSQPGKLPVEIYFGSWKSNG